MASSTRKRALSVDGGDVNAGGRSGERPGKMSRRRRITIAAATTADNIDTDKQEPVKTGGKVKRQAWTATAMAAFFEGLCEHGKDFGRILQFMQTKHKKKHQDAFIGNLNRNQVRFFYYRTWHKVSTLLATAHKSSSNASKKPSIAETDSINSPPLAPPPPPLPALPQPPASPSQSTPSQSEPCHQSDAQGGLVVPTTNDDTNSASAGEETEGEGETGFDTSLDEVCEETTESQVSLPNEEGKSESVAGMLKVVFKESGSLKGPLSACEDNNSTEAASTPALGSTPDKSHQVCGGCSPKGSHGEAKKDKAEGGKEGGTVMVNDTAFSLDLVALICYSKLKQKCPGDKQTIAKKLHELIFTGVTTIRVKGKRKIQIKIPNCPALRSTAKTTTAMAADSKQEYAAADKETDSHGGNGAVITVDLQPLDSTSWTHVQRLSMNPRLRVLLQADRRMEELLSFVAKRWHLTGQDLAQNLQLFGAPSSSCLPTISIASPQPHTDSKSHSVASPPVLDAAGPSAITPPCPPPPPSHSPPPLATKNIESTGVGTESSCDLLPLQFSSDTTISDLKHKLPNQSTSKLVLQYKISERRPAQNQGLESLLRLAEFLMSTEQNRIHQSQPQIHLASTPTGASASCPSLTTSPAVAEYIRSLPKRSPIKSPLAKYRRMKQLRQSPLRMSAERRHSKVATRLNFDSGQSNTTSAAVALSNTRATTAVGGVRAVVLTSSSLTTPPAQQTGSLLSNLSQSAPLPGHTYSLPDTVVPVATGSVMSSQMETSPVSSRINPTSKERKRKASQQKTHLVTVSKKSLRSSGSFSRLDLSNIFTAVNQNLQDASTDREKGPSAQQSAQLAATSNICVAPSTVTSSTVPRQHTMGHLDLSSSHIAASISATSTLPTQQTLTAGSSNGGGGVEMTAANPSPLEQLASQVAGHSLPPINSLPTNMISAKSQISVQPVTLSSSLGANSSSTVTSVPAASFITPLRKPTRRLAKARASTKSSNPNAPRPVVPKLLRYLPNMPQQLSPQVFPTMTPSTTSSSSSSSSTLAPTLTEQSHAVHASPKSLSTSRVSGTLPDHSPNLVRPIQPSPGSSGKVTQQVLQAQLISLLQNMLQQQIRNSQHGAPREQTTAPLSQPPQPSRVSSAAAAVPSHPPSTTSASVASPVTSFAPTSSTTAVIPSSVPLDFDQFMEPLLQPLSSEDPVQPSSDTVNELLKGLYSSSSREEQQHDSLKRLSEETADVLPTFARAVVQMSSSSRGGSNASGDGSVNTAHLSAPLTPPTGGVGTSEPSQHNSSESSDSLLAFLQGDNPAIGTDSNFKQITEQVDFTDVFSQLKDIMRTPEKHRDSLGLRPPAQRGGEVGQWDTAGSTAAGHTLHLPSNHDTENSLNVILADLFNSPMKRTRDQPNTTSDTSHQTVVSTTSAGDMPQARMVGRDSSGGDVTLHSILEENSVDYITRFKELASTMNQSS